MQHNRSKLLNAIYKDTHEVVEYLVNDLTEALVQEGLRVACDYGHPKCAEILLPKASTLNIPELLNTVMSTDNIVHQNEMVELLLAYLHDDQCQKVAQYACQNFWPEIFSSVFERLTENNSAEHIALKTDWAAINGHVDTVKILASQCEAEDLTRSLILAAEAKQWDVCHVLVPLSDCTKVISEFETKQRIHYVNYAPTIERLKDIIQIVECEQQHHRLSQQVDGASVSKTARKI